MIHLPWWLNVWRIDFNTTFSRSSRPVFLKIVLLKFLRNSQENNCGEFSSQQSCWLRACKFLWIFEIFNNAFSIEHPRWLLLVLQVYLHPIINLNMKVLKVLQVSISLFFGDYYVPKDLKFLTSLPVNTQLLHFGIHVPSVLSTPCTHTQNDSLWKKKN